MMAQQPPLMASGVMYGQAPPNNQGDDGYQGLPANPALQAQGNMSDRPTTVDIEWIDD